VGNEVGDTFPNLFSELMGNNSGRYYMRRDTNAVRLVGTVAAYTASSRPKLLTILTFKNKFLV